ncbi:MAG: CHASE2 domain-containing protein, partial [Bdellovibrionota bacterium]
MINPAVLLDVWLRRLGAFLIVVVGLLLIILSFLSREGNFKDTEHATFAQRLLYSAANVENWFYDIRTSRFYRHHRKSPNLVILEMTDESLTKVGRWPWSRATHAKMIDHLREYGAKVLMFDALFPEPESDAADQAMVDAIQKFSAI